MKTKISILLSSLFVVMAMISCDEKEVEDNIEEFIRFNINENAKFPFTPGLVGETIPGGLGSLSITASSDPLADIAQQIVDVNFQKEFDDNNISEEDITSISLAKIEFGFESDSAGITNLNFINSVALYLVDGNTSMDLIKLGELDGIESMDATSISLENLSEINFKAFSDRNQLKFAIGVEVNRIFSEPILIDASIQLLVTPCISVFDSTKDKCNSSL